MCSLCPAPAPPPVQWIRPLQYEWRYAVQPKWPLLSSDPPSSGGMLLMGVLIFSGPVCPQIWRCGVNTSWHHRLATDIRNAAAFLCHVDFGQKILWLQRPQRPEQNRSMTERWTLRGVAVLMLASQRATDTWTVTDGTVHRQMLFSEDFIHTI